MTSAALSPQEMDDALASEYVLGVLDPDERAEAELRIQREPEFARLVLDWETRMGGPQNEAAKATAAEGLTAIEAGPLLPRRRSRRSGQLAGWLAGATVALVLVLATIGLVAPPKTALVAMLATADNRLAYEVTQVGETLRVTRVAGLPAGSGMAHELWLLAPGKAPVSLGLLQDDPLVVAHSVLPAGWQLTVSLEAEGGSTLGIPSGPVILSADIGG